MPTLQTASPLRGALKSGSSPPGATAKRNPWDLHLPDPGTAALGSNGSNSSSPLKRTSPSSPLEGSPEWSANGGGPAKMARMMDFVPGELSLEDKNTLTDAVLRYFYYVEYGIPTKHIAPFREEWAGNALAMVPQEPPEKVCIACRA